MFTCTLRRFVLAVAFTIAGSAAASAQSRTADRPTVHVVAIGDTAVGGDFGRKLGEDAQNFTATFRQAFEAAGRSSQLRTHVLLGADATPAKILARIRQLAVQPDDALVVLASCHGATYAEGHGLSLRHGRLLRRDILAAMQAQHPRLMVLLTDCCSAGVPGRPVVPSYEPRPLVSGATMEWRTVESLFLRHQGLVDITAAEPGYCGKIDRRKSGSLFTNALVHTLRASHRDLVRSLDGVTPNGRDGELQWDEVLPQLRGLAARYDEEQTSERGVRPQHAYATDLGRWMRR